MPGVSTRFHARQFFVYILVARFTRQPLQANIEPWVQSLNLHNTAKQSMSRHTNLDDILIVPLHITLFVSHVMINWCGKNEKGTRPIWRYKTKYRSFQPTTTQKNFNFPGLTKK